MYVKIVKPWSGYAVGRVYWINHTGQQQMLIEHYKVGVQTNKAGVPVDDKPKARAKDSSPVPTGDAGGTEVSTGPGDVSDDPGPGPSEKPKVSDKPRRKRKQQDSGS